jgi:Domain of unknown function (DUF4821)
VLSLFEEVKTGNFEQSSAETKNVWSNYKILVLRREFFLCKLLVREARIEDNDDVIAVLRKNDPAVVDGQEKFFLANLIQTRDESNRFYVGIAKKRLVGIVATSTKINTAMIRKTFDVDALSDVIIRNEPEVKPPIKVIALVGKVHLLDKTTIKDLSKELNCIYIDAIDCPCRSSAMSDKDGLSKSALSVDDIEMLIVQSCDEYMVRNSDNQPVACILNGFPSNVSDIMAVLESVDMIVEVTRCLSSSITTTAAAAAAAAIAAVHDVDKEDAVTLCHIHAAEQLKATLLNNNETAADMYQHVQYSKLPDEGDAIELLTENLSITVTQIKEELRILLEHDEAEQLKCNAFTVTLSCTDEGYETQAIDILRVAFEDFDQLDYCLCLIPNDTPLTPLLQLMTRVKELPGMCSHQSLYLLHKDFFHTKQHLRVVRLSDTLFPELEQFLKPLGDSHTKSLNAAKNSLQYNDTDLGDKPLEASFMLMFGTRVAGFAIISRKVSTDEYINKLREEYNLDEMVEYDKHPTRSQAFITHCLIDPVFSPWFQFTLREIMRTYGKTVLYYRFTDGYVPAAEMVNELIQVSPRRAIQRAIRTINSNKNNHENNYVTTSSSGNIDISMHKHPLFYISKNKLSKRKKVLNDRIVIIGGSAHAHAVLETLCYLPDITLSNVYVVGDQRPSAVSLPQSSSDFLPGSEFTGCLSPRDVGGPCIDGIMCLGLPYKATYVKGQVTSINRDQKCVGTSNGVTWQYDVLVIASHSQGVWLNYFTVTFCIIMVRIIFICFLIFVVLRFVLYCFFCFFCFFLDLLCCCYTRSYLYDCYC